MKKLVVVLLGAGFVTFTHAQAEAACGVLKVSKGDVKIESGKKPAAPAPEGTKICSGDTIIAGNDSRAKIVMEDGNELNISPQSKIAIENYEFKPAENKKKVLLNVLSGKVRATTTPNMYNDKSKDGQANTFQVKTKSAVAGVRGTDFLTGYNPSTRKAEVVTFSGKVEVGQPGPGGQIMNSVQVTPGQKTEVAAGQPPAPPKPVPPGQLNQMNQETKADTTVGGPSSDTGASAGGDKSDDSKDDAKSDDAKSDAKSDGKASGDDKKSDDKKSGDDKKAAGDKSDDKGGDKNGDKNADKKSGGDDKKADSGKKEGGDKQASGGDDKKSGGDSKQADSGKKEGGANGGDKQASGSSDKKGGDSKQANSGGASSGGSTSSGGSASEGSGRAPASTGSSSSSPQPPKLMMEGPGSGGMATAPPPPPTIIIPTLPTIQLPPTIPKSDFIDSTVANGPSKVKVNIIMPK